MKTAKIIKIMGKAGGIGISVCLLCFFLIADCLAASDFLVVRSALVWRGDGKGDYLFKDNGNFSGTAIGADGSVESQAQEGTYELKFPYTADSLIKSVTVNWVFTGKVTLEVSATGREYDYVRVVNGAPLNKGFTEGSSLRWKATLAPGSKLSEVRINYEDILGIESSWGNHELSGFNFKKPVFIKGVAQEELFNYPVLFKIGENSKPENCDFYLKGSIQSAFSDIRFTQEDGETLLPYWVESISGEAPNRVVSVWVKIPQIPSSGIKICLFYGKAAAFDLSDGQKVFDFFDDFKTGGFDTAKWQDYGFLDENAVIEYKVESEEETKTLSTAGLTTDAIIEFFQEFSLYDWIRGRKTAATSPAVDVNNTNAAAEELPNLADFQGVKTAVNGDLVLEEDSVSGTYVSPDYFPLFETLIMIPAWEALNSSGGSIGVDISADNDHFKRGCVNEDYYYAGRKDFVKGSKLKWHIRLNRTSAASLSPRMRFFSLDYRPGTITLVSPNGGEKLSANSAYKIIWSAWEYEPSYRMKLEYSTDSGISYNLINEAVNNTGMYNWKVPDVTSNKVLLKVSDALDGSVFDTSRGYFSVLNGRIKTALSQTKTFSSRAESGGITQEQQVVTSEQVIEKESGISPEPEVLSTKQVKTVELDRVISRKKQSGAIRYDLVFKVDDPANIKEEMAGSYEGELLAVMPAGNRWSEAEKNSFLILPVYLTQEKLDELNKQEEISTGQKDGFGNPVIITVEKKYKIDLEKIGLVSNRLKKIERGKKNIRDINTELKEKREGINIIK